MAAAAILPPPGSTSPAPVDAHPGNDYYVNAITGSVQRQSNPALAAGLHLAGYLGPYSWAEANGISAGLKASGASDPGGAGAGLSPTKASTLFHGLNLGNWLLRVGEILAGLILLAIGLNSMLGGRPLKMVTQAAGVAAKVVP